MSTKRIPGRLGMASAVALALLLSASGVNADHHRHDGYGGATDGYTGATDQNDDWRRHDRRLEREQRRALKRFERQRSRDYRELGQRRFRSDGARERAYRELERRHEARLHEMLGDTRYRQERRRYDDDERRGYDRPEDAVINLILRELLND